MRFRDVDGNEGTCVRLEGPLIFMGPNGEQTAGPGEWFCEPDPINGVAYRPFALTDEVIRRDFELFE